MQRKYNILRDHLKLRGVIIRKFSAIEYERTQKVHKTHQDDSTQNDRDIESYVSVPNPTG